MRTLKKIPLFLFLAAALLLFMGAAPSKPSDGTAYTIDFADVLSPEHQEAMEQNAVQLMQDIGVEMLTVAVEGCSGAEPADFLAKLIASWKPGGELQDSYVLLLYSVEDNSAWISPGSRLRADLTTQMLQENVVDAILRPNIERGEVSRALYEGQRELVLSVYKAFGTAPRQEAPETPPSQKENESKMRAIVILGCMVIILRSFYVSHKARARYEKLYGKGSLVKRKRFARTDADIEYTHENKRDTFDDED